MTSKFNLRKSLTFRVMQLDECHQKLQASLGAYVGQIAGCAQAWIKKSEDCDQDKFVDITLQLDEAMIMLIEMTSDIENNLAGLPSGAGKAVQSTADSPAQINAASPGLDASIRSLLERLDALRNVTDMVQELRTDLDACKTQMDSVERMRESLENITSHCGILIRAQVESRLEQFQTSQLTQIQHFEKELSQMQASLSKTDSEVKDVANFVNIFSEQCADRIRTLTEPEELPAVENSAQIECQHQDHSLSDLDGRLWHLETVTDTTDDSIRGIKEELAELKRELRELFSDEFTDSTWNRDDLMEEAMTWREKVMTRREKEMTHREEEMTRREEAMTCREEASLQMDSVESTVSSQSPAVKVTEPPVTRGSGFFVQCLDDIMTMPWSTAIRWKFLCRDTSCDFDVRDNVFTAPVGGLYSVHFVHYQTGTKPTTVRVILSGEGYQQEKVLITTDTTNRGEYAVGQRCVVMDAGDTFYLSLPPKHCRFQVPGFSCVLVS